MFISEENSPFDLFAIIACYPFSKVKVILFTVFNKKIKISAQTNIY